MPSKKKKFNARFPPARIKKIMQTDEEIGKVAAAVPVIISRALELFVASLVKKTSVITKSRNAKTLTTTHL
ncbi:dr1-associated corepressor [Caerostris extrusa]|nr:dr1-associated corepressor [Caerostris extrusa]